MAAKPLVPSARQSVAKEASISVEAPASSTGLVYAQEVDETRWVSAGEAEALLTYERDLLVLRAAVR